MGFETLQPVPVQRVDTIVEVVRRGDGTHASDDVFVTTNLTLAADLDPKQDAVLVLPMASTAQQQPLLRYTNTPINGKQVFAFDDTARSDFDEAVIDRMAALADGASKKEQAALATAIKRAAASLSTTVLKVEPGQRDLRLFYSVASPKVADREFEFTVIGPLPSFIIGAGGSIHLTALLPRGAGYVSGVAYTDPANPGSQQLPVNPVDLSGRTALAWQWQNDPLFRVRYRY